MDREREFSKKQIPLVALPTTAGTGSEVTPFSVLTNSETGAKKSLPSPYFYPDAAVVLPEFLATVPAKVIGDCGLDALAHAYEALWSINANPVSDALAFKAIKLISDNFAAHYAAPSDPGPAAAMAEGATIAGMAFSNTLTAGCHALSYPIGRIFGLSHGASCAMTLHLVAEMNADAVADKFTQLAAYLGLSDRHAVPASILELRAPVDTIPTLRELGASREQLEEVAAGAFEPLLRNNPVPMPAKRIVDLLEPEIA
jgi:alcohol dehydrogenase class IV